MSILTIVLAAMTCGCGGTLKDIDVDIQAPPVAKSGQEFILTATVENHAAKAQKLISLDIGDQYLNGIAILSTEPNYHDTSHVPILNQRSYEFDLPVNPGEKVQVLLHARAVKTGDFNSEISFYINSSSSSLARSVRTTVE
ncbi:MAG: hypothetical protein WCF17_11960 [Terracidiphilus sp.]